jgi:hypothetical protein
MSKITTSDTMKNIKRFLYIAAIGIMLVAQLLHPASVFADGEGTPPPTSTLEVTETPQPTETLVETALPSSTPENTVSPEETTFPTDVPTVTPTPSPNEPTAEPDTAMPIPTEFVMPGAEESTVEPVATTPAPTGVPIEEENETKATPTDASTPTAEPTAAQDDSYAEEPSLGEVLSEIPVETDVVVLDESGQPEPLATVEAAEAVSSGDPIWCPAGQAPTPGLNGCTTSYTTLGDLVASVGASINANGTIWITSGATADTSPVIIDGSVYTNWANYSLTLQGGWNGVSGDTTIETNSVFSIPINILSWNSGITVNNLTFQNVSGTALKVYTQGDVAINNSIFQQNSMGADVSTQGDVAINNSLFQQNSMGAFIGLHPLYESNLSVNNSTFESINDIDVGIGISCCYDLPDGNAICTGTILYEASPPSNWQFKLVCHEPPAPTPVPTPFFKVQVKTEINFDCSKQAAYPVQLPNGDLVNIFCPVSGTASIYRLDNTGLPENLPEGYTYASAFTLDIKQKGVPIPVITEGGYVKSSFVAQPLQPGNTYTVLYWDPWVNENGNLVENPAGGSWVPLKDFLFDGDGNVESFDLFPGTNDLRSVISGVNLVSESNADRVEVSTNFPGIFVLAQH